MKANLTSPLECAAPPPVPAECAALGTSLRVGAVELESLTDGACWRGIGAVRIAGRTVRCGLRPMGAEVRSPCGVSFVDPRVSRVERIDGGVDLHLGLHRAVGGPMEWMVHEVRPRYAVADWAAAPTFDPQTTLMLRLRPVERKVGDLAAVGFRYQYHYRNEHTSIY